MPETYRHTRAFRGATFEDADLTGVTFRDCGMAGVRIVGSLIADIRIAGYAGEGARILVNDVDVSAFVAAELDRLHPERVQVRAARTADEPRAAWDTLERLRAETVARAERLPEPVRFERVDDEWSLGETVRHLVFATDVWLGRMVLGEAMPQVHAGRQASVRRVLAGLDDAALEELLTAVPAPPGGEETHTVRDCLRVLLDEVCEHRRFAVRDLAVLEER